MSEKNLKTETQVLGQPSVHLVVNDRSRRVEGVSMFLSQRAHKVLPLLIFFIYIISL
jgi:hypothetical protein